MAATTFASDPRSMLQSIHAGFSGVDTPAYRTAVGDLSFAKLHDASAALAERLMTMDAGQNRHPVLIWGHKDLPYMVAYWACLLAGMPLVPVEPETPVDRLCQIAEVCQADIILDATIDAPFIDILSVPGLPVLDIDVNAVPLASVTVPDFAADDVAYIMFSSGTLGQPKGIQVTYTNLADFVDWLPELLPETDHAGVTGNIRHCFDVSLFELWMSWTRRAPITALDHADFANSTGYIARLANDGVTLSVSTPSITRLLLKNKRYNGDVLPQMRAFVFCGEPLTKAIVAELFTRFPGCRVVNTYGPTECTVAVTSVDITAAHLTAEEDIPIGTPRHGVMVYTANDTSCGEMMIAGKCVAKGYFGLPEKQAHAFPFTQTYRSGDWAAVDAQGQWTFQGRMDREVKIQGVRIDLNDIEAHIRKQEGVEDVVVEPYMLRGEPRALNAFVIGDASDETLASLAQTLASELPPYLVPRFWYSGFVTVLNNNSKIDRSHLHDAVKTAAFKHVHTA
ncbi:AMP-binding protein [Yoonia maritima]|nr:AMP-binding protein [Yoonia maritima]